MIYKTRSSVESLEETKNTNLYFEYMGGVGIVKCFDCDYQEQILSFTHGGSQPNNTWTRIGLQCQSCGKFHVSDDVRNRSNNSSKCECGGKLEREMPILCPKCKSKNMKYEMIYIT